jgi:chaperonin cofactor prefoldin
MKKFILIALLVPILFGCDNKKKEYETLSARYDSLLVIGFTKDTALIGYMEAFNTIQSNLDSIMVAEMIISQSTSTEGEVQPDVRAKINRDINMILEKLQQNKNTIATLRSKMKSSNNQVTVLDEMIERMNRQQEQKDVEIAELSERLKRMNIQIDTLMAQGEAKSQTISEQTTALNTAYYVMGTKKELREQNIITIEGGFAGIGRNKKIKDDFDSKYFTRIDITRFNSIPIMHKKVDIITTHPSQSYKIYGEKSVDSLVIINAKEFWSASKYLVIVID